MTVEIYDKRLRAIKRELSFFRADSILNRTLSHLHWGQTNDVPGGGMPWLAFFMLKLGMLEGKDEGRDMSVIEFNNIMEKLYKLQGAACSIEVGGVELKLRPMFLQQEWYQRNLVEEIKSLVRQSIWFTNEGSDYSVRFQQEYGIGLRDFYNISLYLVVSVAVSKKGIVGVNLYSLIMHLVPAVSVNAIANYILLVGVRSQDLPRFFSQHKLSFSVNQQSEYFQTTPLRWKPLLLDGENLFVCHPKLFVSGVGMLIPSLLKKINVPGWQFKVEFGAGMELYMGSTLKEAGIEYYTEDGINDLCRSENVFKGKATDFLIPGEINLLVECKAIEPSDVVSSVFDPEVLRRDLEKSFIKAILQCQETIFRLSEMRKFKSSKFVCVVVTHEDFWFASAGDVGRYIDPGLAASIESKYGILPLQLDNIIFININTWESILASVSKVGTNLAEIITSCAESLTTPEGRRFTATQSIQEKLSGTIYGLSSIAEHAKKWQEWLELIINENKMLWQGETAKLVESRSQLLRYVHARFKEETFL